MSIENIIDSGIFFAIIIKKDHFEDGINFVTPADFSQQLAYMHHPAGKIIKPHRHLSTPKIVNHTQEVLIIKRGKIRVDFYNSDKIYIKSRILEDGDIILLASAGHGFEVLEEVEMIEIKQGPYSGEESDKIKFEPVQSSQVIFD